ETKADDLWDEHSDRLPEHGRLGLNAADPPAQDPESVDHSGVRIRADERVGVGAAHAAGLGIEDHASKVLKVHLVHDAGVGWYDREVAKRGLAPAQERVALLVTCELDGGVARECPREAVLIDLHRVIDHQL